jgi:hypothetical protein
MDFHVVHVTSEMPSYMEKREKVCITSGPEFGASLNGKNLIISKYLYGLLTSAPT